MTQMKMHVTNETLFPNETDIVTPGYCFFLTLAFIIKLRVTYKFLPLILYVSHHCKFLILIMREKKLKIGKNLLVLGKSLNVTIAGI